MRKPVDSVDSPLFQTARSAPDACAILDCPEYTYASLREFVECGSGQLRARGLRQGDRVLILGVPSAGYAGVLWSVLHALAVACPLNPSLPGPTLKKIMALLRPACVIHDESNAALAGGLDLPRLTFADLESQDKEAGAPSALEPVLPATVILTSGSSGAPKAAVHTLQNHVSAARAANANLPLKPGDVWLLSLPLFHVSGLSLLFRCALAGAALAVPRPGAPLSEELVRTGATHVSLVPTQLARLLADPHGREALQRMKGVLLGGAPSDEALVRRACAAGTPLVRSYGMTETSAQLCATAPGAPVEDLCTSGVPFVPGTLRISETGEIEVRGPAVFAGYYEEGGKVIRPETPDGWFRTGDLGRLDERGRLHVAGRADAMFISGGENIYPEEIEEKLLSMPGVERAAVVEVPDEVYGARPVAFVRGASDFQPTADDIREWLTGQLPRFKIPCAFFPWPEQASRSVKIDRSFFRAEALKQYRPHAR